MNKISNKFVKKKYSLTIDPVHYLVFNKLIIRPCFRTRILRTKYTI